MMTAQIHTMVVYGACCVTLANGRDAVAGREGISRVGESRPVSSGRGRMEAATALSFLGTR